MIRVTKKLVCDLCGESVGIDIQEWPDSKIKNEAAKVGWLVNYKNGHEELLDICPECRENIATRAAQLCVQTKSGGGTSEPATE